MLSILILCLSLCFFGDAFGPQMFSHSYFQVCPLKMNRDTKHMQDSPSEVINIHTHFLLSFNVSLVYISVLNSCWICSMTCVKTNFLPIIFIQYSSH